MQHWLAAARLGEHPADHSGLAVLIGLAASALGFGTAAAVIRKGRRSARRR